MVEAEGEEALGRMVVPEGPDSSLCPGWAGSRSRSAGLWGSCRAALIRGGQAGHRVSTSTGTLPVARREVAKQESQEPLGE